MSGFGASFHSLGSSAAAAVPRPQPPPAATPYTTITPSRLALPPPLKRWFEWDSEFFFLGNEERERDARNQRAHVREIAKQVAPGSEFDDCVDEFECDIDQCRLVFTSLAAFDHHYLTAHTYKCEICGLKLPNNRLLEMHISERHDELFRVLARKKRMYACLVEGCDQKSNSRRGRQLHLVDKHSYPPNYTYDRRQTRGGQRSGKARQKERPQKIDADAMNDSMTSDTTEAIQPTPATRAASSSCSDASPSPSPPVARAPVVSRSTVLSFMPRSVRAHQLAAALPKSFTRMRDPAERAAHQQAASSMDDASMLDIAAEADKENDDAMNDAPTSSGDGADIDAQVGLSRLNVEGTQARTLPKKMTFGALNRRHA